jgi:hypothetical protein
VALAAGKPKVIFTGFVGHCTGSEAKAVTAADAATSETIKFFTAMGVSLGKFMTGPTVKYYSAIEHMSNKRLCYDK